ncbi:putative oxidoreductase SadH [mine drainage metagenome]|uniref:Putative oxidoreductase SadH n=1 Tax=mine drainage metagenome TaxID=410659 RepID=A0A1J5SXM6_9ZZZZ
MSRIENKKALITGGASGIGKLMGKLLLQKGLHTLVIWDVNENLLNTVTNEFKQQGFNVLPYVVDVMNTDAVIATAQQVKNDAGKIDILINNAGIIVGKSFADHSHSDIDRTMIINSSALMHITKEFLQDMIVTKCGHIVNIASAAGLTSNPNMSVYVASKWAVIGWSDSLRLEMEKMNNDVKVTTVTPYYINTGMFAGVKSSVIPIVDQNVAAQKIINGIEKNKLFVRMPDIVYALLFIKGILPARWFDVVIGKWFGVYKSMDEFKGRK